MIGHRAPAIPGQFWVTAWVQNSEGKQQGRTSHALVYAPSAVAAAQLPIVELIRERLEAGLLPGMWEIVINVAPARGEAVPSAN